MKRQVVKVALVLGVILAAVGCKKEQVKQVVDENADVNALVLQTDAGVEDDAYVDLNSNTIFLYNAGLSSDYVVEDNDMDDVQGPNGGDDSLSGRDSGREFVKSKSFIKCLRGINLTERQKVGIKIAIGEYRKCREVAEKRARAIYAQLQNEYKSKVENLKVALKNGRITEKEFQGKIAQLRMDFKSELRELQLREKLHEAIKKCFRGFLGDLKSILSAEQWRKFVGCHRR